MKFKSSISLGALVLATLGSVSTHAQLGASEEPSLKVGRASLVSPAAARQYYASSSAIKEATFVPSSHTAPELKALARSLKNDPELIFQYVHDKIDFVPLYGLQKGALGAYLDGAGTAFDQAQLMVELLREAGYSNAEYVLGDIKVSATELRDWIGVSDAKAACHILADGGIPATIGASSDASCGYSGSLTQDVTLSHVWVKLGSQYYDPAFKKYETIQGELDLAAKTQYSASNFMDAAGGTSAGNNLIRGFNSTDINNKLDTYAERLIDVLNENANYAKSLESLIGGRKITALAERFTDSGEENTQGHYDSTKYSSLSTIDQLSAVYRTTVSLTFEWQGAGISGTNAPIIFFADDLYGRRLNFEWVDYDNPHVPSDAKLKLDDSVVATISTHPGGAAVPGSEQDAAYKVVNGGATDIQFDVNHAYAASDGKYMDRSYARNAGGFSQPVSFVFGFAGKSTNLASKLTSEHYGDVENASQGACRRDTNTGPTIPDSGGPAGNSSIKLSEHQKTQIAYGWLGQFDRALDLQAQIVDAVVQHHHSFGMALSTVNWEDACSSYTESEPVYTMNSSAMQLDVLSGISVNDLSGDDNESRATAQSMAMIGATLEGSVFEQFAGKYGTASTTERFEWFNREFSSEYFHILDGSEDADTGLSGHQWHKQYTDKGYLVIAPHEILLGPGARYSTTGKEGSETHQCWFGATPCDMEVEQGNQRLPDRSYEAGAAFLAIKPDSSEIAHIVFSGKDTAKGGGASEEENDGDQFDHAKIADILKDKFEDRSRMHGVDIATGQVSYSPPADIKSGAGEFPYSLSFQRTYSSGAAGSRGLGTSWSHNWDISLSLSGSGAEAMGATKPVRAVPSLVAFYVMQDILAGNTTLAKDTSTLKRVLVPMFVAHWWREHLQNNVASVTQGTSGTQFVRLADNTFDAPFGSTAKLVQYGARVVQDAQTCNDLLRTNHACRQAYTYKGLSYTLTNPGGDEIVFDLNNDDPAEIENHSTGGDIPTPNPNVPQILPSKWTFPSGVELTFNYDFEYGRLTSVASNLGGETNTNTGPFLSFNWTGERLDSVSGKGVSATEFGYGSGGATDGYPIVMHTGPVKTKPNERILTEVINALGEKTEYTYAGKGLNEGSSCLDADARNDWKPRLCSVKTPDHGNDTLRFTYDSELRVRKLADAYAIDRNSPDGDWEFYSVPGFRGERKSPTAEVFDPATGTRNSVPLSYFVEYNVDGFAFRHTDEAGQTVLTEYDDMGRVLKRTMPEGNSVSFLYDKWSNVISMTQHAKPDSNDGSLTASAEYIDGTNLVRQVTDLRGLTTVLKYDNYTGTGEQGEPSLSKRLVTKAIRPDDAAGRAVEYNYAYNQFGQLIRSTNPEGIISLNEYNGYGLMVASAQNCGSAAATTVAECVSAADRSLAISRFAYNLAGDVVRTDGPLGLDANGKPDVSSTFYDQLRRPIHQLMGDIPQSAASNIQNAAKAAGVEHRSYTSYDEMGRPRTVFSWGTVGSNTETQTVTKTFVEGGVRCHASEACSDMSPDGQTTKYVYDALGRKTMVVQQMDANDVERRTKTDFDVLGRPVNVYQGWDSGRDILYQHYGYTLSGQAAHVMDANCNVTTYHYDGHDRLVATYFPPKVSIDAQVPKTALRDRCLNPANQNWPTAYSGGAHTYADREEYIYDNGGNLLAKRTRKGDWIVNVYDNLNRVIDKRTFRNTSGDSAAADFASIVISFPEAANDNHAKLEKKVSYSYYRDGRDDTISQSAGSAAISGTIPAVTLEYGYDTGGRQTSETVTANGRTRTVSVSLDEAGNRLALTHPDADPDATQTDTFSVSMAYDYMGRMTDIVANRHAATSANKPQASFPVAYEYDGFKRMQKLKAGQQGAQVVTSYGYYIDNALKHISHNFASSSWNGQQGINLDVKYAFKYNAVNQVVNRQISNEVFRPRPEVSKELGYKVNGLNQYTQIKDTTGEEVENTLLSYDANGSLTFDGRWTFTYDVENRLVTAVNAGTTVKYQYGPKGRRLFSTGVSGRTDYVYEGDEPIADYDQTGALLRRYVNGAAVDERVMYLDYTGVDLQTYGPAVRYYHRDHQGSIVAMSNAATQQVSDVYSYDPYGNMLSGTEGGQPFRYTGRRYDAETGLYYYRARYYSSELGRFLQTDPIGYEDNMNLYGYTANDPVNGTDPSGEFGFFGAIVGAVVDAAIQGVEMAAGQRESFDAKSVLVSAAAGAAGVGLLSKVNKLAKLGLAGKELAKTTVEAGVSVGESLAKGDDVTVTGVVADVVLGGRGGEAAGRSLAKSTNAYQGAKKSAVAQERRSRDSRNSATKKGRHASRAQNARNQQQKIEDKGGAIGSEIVAETSKEVINCKEGQAC